MLKHLLQSAVCLRLLAGSDCVHVHAVNVQGYQCRLLHFSVRIAKDQGRLVLISYHALIAFSLPMPGTCRTAVLLPARRRKPFPTALHTNPLADGNSGMAIVVKQKVPHLCLCPGSGSGHQQMWIECMNRASTEISSLASLIQLQEFVSSRASETS